MACPPIVSQQSRQYDRGRGTAGSWRFSGSVATLVMSFLVTGRIKWALASSGGE
jgi:hypothetical protein